MTTVNAPAKVNLMLHVLGKRDDGYHDLESLVAFADIHDTLHFEPHDGLKLTVNGPFASAVPHKNNLVIQAAQALAQHLKTALNVHITLTKNIPVKAGLGGGSADAAATLRGLVEFLEISVTEAELQVLALNLGSDVPVCLVSQAAMMSGRGEHVEPLNTFAKLPIVLVNPMLEISTPDVFTKLNGAFHHQKIAMPVLEDVASTLAWLSEQKNSLLAPAMSLVPEISVCLKAIQRTNARVTNMSGSGATCFGLYDTVEAAKTAEEMLRKEHPNWWIYAGYVN